MVAKFFQEFFMFLINVERNCCLELFMRGCLERNGSAQNGSKRSCKREAYPYLRVTFPYRTVPQSRVNATYVFCSHGYILYGYAFFNNAGIVETRKRKFYQDHVFCRGSHTKVYNSAAFPKKPFNAEAVSQKRQQKNKICGRREHSIIYDRSGG